MLWRHGDTASNVACSVPIPQFTWLAGLWQTNLSEAFRRSHRSLTLEVVVAMMAIWRWQDMGRVRLAVAWMGMVATLGGCAASLHSRMAPTDAKAVIERVLAVQGYESIETAAVDRDWVITGELRRSYPYLETRYRVSQEPSLRPEPGGNNLTVLEEKVDYSQSTTTRREQAMVFRARVTLPMAGADSPISVRVTGPEAVRTDKYRDITWVGDEPPSPRQLEETLIKALRRILAD